MWNRDSIYVNPESLREIPEERFSQKCLGIAWAKQADVDLESDGYAVFNYNRTRCKDFYYWYIILEREGFKTLCRQMRDKDKDWLQRFLEEEFYNGIYSLNGMNFRFNWEVLDEDIRA